MTDISTYMYIPPTEDKEYWLGVFNNYGYTLQSIVPSELVGTMLEIRGPLENYFAMQKNIDEHYRWED